MKIKIKIVFILSRDSSPRKTFCVSRGTGRCSTFSPRPSPTAAWCGTSGRTSLSSRCRTECRGYVGDDARICSRCGGFGGKKWKFSLFPASRWNASALLGIQEWPRRCACRPKMITPRSFSCGTSDSRQVRCRAWSNTQREFSPWPGARKIPTSCSPAARTTRWSAGTRTRLNPAEKSSIR